jgi:hypothetical protein
MDPDPEYRIPAAASKEMEKTKIGCKYEMVEE